MAIYGEEKHNKNMEGSFQRPSFTVRLEFTDVDARNPLEATKKILKWLQEDADTMIYDVINEQTNAKFTVDLSENDEDAVLPNND